MADDRTADHPNRAAPPPPPRASGHPTPGPRGSLFPHPDLESVTTIRPDGSRPFLFPAETHGRFTRGRLWSAYGLIFFFLALPWIKINGHPAVFLDIAERRFHLFGLTFSAQDLWLLFFVITGLGFSLFFVTALLGRIWCGWACPQTVYLEHVYRRLERWIEGDAVQRRLLAAAPLSGAKLAKKIVKHALYVLVSAIVMHIFLAYFVSLPEVWHMVSSAPGEHWGAFGFMAVSTALVYFNFAWFREQLCIVICPYGRIQSALVDEHTLVIGYDARRGEPRGRARHHKPGVPVHESAPAEGATAAEGMKLGLPTEGLAKVGDCVDCQRCVHVCPTGIDIRQGLQMECIGCTACIDACDDVMVRLHRPRGLIRYDSQTAFAGQRTRWLRPRMFLYLALLLVGMGVLTRALLTVKPANLGVTRMVGAPYIVETSTIRNQFLVRIVNKRNAPAKFLLQLGAAPAGLRQVGAAAPLEVPPHGELVHPLILQQTRASYTGPFHFTVRIEDPDRKFQIEREIEFLGPEARLLREEEEERRARK